MCEKSAAKNPFSSGLRARFSTAGCLLRSFFAVFLILASVSAAKAESVTSKNKEGNRLFAQGRYEDAEKAYLDAEAQDPGRSEIIYNLGNSLIKQRQFDRALQSLHQAISKGNKGIQESSWYNSGNALFSMGNFKDSAQAFTQALRINPADSDAKHNLELALQKMTQKKQTGSGNSQNQQQSEESKQSKGPARNEPQPSQENRQSSPERQDQNKPANPQGTQANEREGSFSRERALQILDALQNQELVEQRKLLEQRARRKANGKDW